MRKVVLMVGVLALVVSVAALAAETGGKKHEVASKLDAELKKIDARLKLSDDQKTRVRSLLAEQDGKLDALYKEIEPREKAVMQEYRGKIRGVLTPTQQAEWDKIKSEYRAKWNGKQAAGKSAAAKTESQHWPE